MKSLSEFDALLLAVIRDRDHPSHGIDIGREVEARLQKYAPAATLYRALHRLEDAGFLDAHWESDDQRHHRGPKRRYYAINPSGLASLNEYLRGFSRRAGVLGWAPDAPL